MSNRTSLGPMSAVLLVTAAVLGLGGFICGTTGNGTVTPATAGPIFVNVGYGAVTSTPYDCTGGGSVTVTPQSLTGTGGNGAEQTQQYSFSGKSSTTPNEPACQVNVSFPGKSPGTWQVGNGQAACTGTVTAGQSTTVKIWNGACS